MKMRWFRVPIVSLSFWTQSVITTRDPRLLREEGHVYMCQCLHVRSPGKQGQSRRGCRALQPQTFRV